MGLDIYAADEHYRVGSYSYVHQNRAMLIRLFCAQLESAGNHGEAKIIKTLLDDSKGTGIDYHLVDLLYSDLYHIPQPSKNAIEGLEAWVNHSDCDGKLTVGQVEQIVSLLRYVAPQSTSLERYQRIELADMTAFFEKALILEQSIEFS